MALVFSNGSSDRVQVTANSTIDDLTAFSIIMWVLTTTDTQGRRMWDKTGAGGDTKLQIGFSTIKDLTFEVGRATTRAQASSQAYFLELDTWQLFAMTYDESDGPRLFEGNLTKTVVEEGTYLTRDVGSGATDANNTGDLYIGNNSGLASGYPGRFGTFQMFDKRLSLAEIQSQQFYPYVTPETVVYHVYHGTGTQADYSGNGNNGAVTGATVGDHVPLPPPFGFDIGAYFLQGAAAAAGPFLPYYDKRPNVLLRM